MKPHLLLPFLIRLQIYTELGVFQVFSVLLSVCQSEIFLLLLSSVPTLCPYTHVTATSPRAKEERG